MGYKGRLSRIETPLGVVLAGFDINTGELILLQWEQSTVLDYWMNRLAGKIRKGTAEECVTLSRCLYSYFDDRTMTYDGFRRLKWSLPEDTPFRMKVWQSLSELSHPVSYKDFATSIGSPTSTRSVASAVAKNPLQVILPCHLVIPSGNRGTGKYAAGAGLKEQILRVREQPHSR